MLYSTSNTNDISDPIQVPQHLFKEYTPIHITVSNSAVVQIQGRNTVYSTDWVDVGTANKTIRHLLKQYPEYRLLITSNTGVVTFDVILYSRLLDLKFS